MQVEASRGLLQSRDSERLRTFRAGMPVGMPQINPHDGVVCEAATRRMDFRRLHRRTTKIGSTDAAPHELHPCWGRLTCSRFASSRALTSRTDGWSRACSSLTPSSCSALSSVRLLELVQLPTTAASHASRR